MMCPADSSELNFLPLESANRDDPFPGGGGVSVSRGGGGAFTWLMLAMPPLLRLRSIGTAANLRRQ